MPKRLRKLLLLLLALVLIGLLLYKSSGFLASVNFSWPKLWAAIRGADPLLLGLGVVGIYACYGIRSLRWQVFQRNLGAGHFWTILKLNLAGFASIFILGRAGEPIRPVLLAKKERSPIADLFGIYFLERIFDAASTVAIAAIALTLFHGNARQEGGSHLLERAARTTGVFLLMFVIGAIAGLVYLRLHGTEALQRRLQGWLHAKNWKTTLANVVLGFARGVQTVRTWGDLLLAIGYSALHWALVVYVYLWVSHAFGGKFLTLDLGDAMLLLAFTVVGSAVQVPVAGGGSQLAALLVYTTVFGIEKEPATAAAIVIWLITFAACTLVGVPLLVHEGFSLGQLRKIARQEREELRSETGISES